MEQQLLRIACQCYSRDEFPVGATINANTSMLQQEVIFGDLQ